MKKLVVLHKSYFLMRIVISFAVLWGCNQPPPTLPPPTKPGLVTFPGKENQTISVPNTVVNRYITLNQDAIKGSNQLNLGQSALNALMPVSSGDLLLIIQMQGAQIDTSQTAAYGTVVLPTKAGLYEFVRVSQVDSNSGIINLDITTGGLQNDYSAAGKTQVVFVPEYAQLTVSTGGSLIPLPWNGNEGGIVAVKAQKIVLEGTIDASGMGFLGGEVHNSGSNLVNDVVIYVTTNPAGGGEKGQSIAGGGGDYDHLGGRYGRGAPANGGGGGNPYQAGGGGGANATAPTKTWSGQGVMTMMWQTGWLKEVATLADSAGAGRGGYTNSTAVLDPTMFAPGDPMWSGNHRRERGGLGGHSIDGDTRKQLFLGGGGGAGDVEATSPAEAGKGGNGGGIVILVAKDIQGSGGILSNGQKGVDSGTSSPNAGGGGGGGGGSILLSAASVQSIQIKAEGGAGGNHAGTGMEADGPGGGGGGGLIALPMTTVTPSVLGGQGGHSQSGTMTNFLPNGASDGALGNIITFTQGSADLAVRVSSDVSAVPLPNSSFSYSVKIYNAGPDFVVNAPVAGNLTPAYPNASWVCQSADLTLASCTTKTGGDTINTQVTLAPGTFVELTMGVPVPSYENNDDIDLAVSITPPANISDPNLTNNQVNLLLHSPANVVLTARANTYFLVPNTPIEYTFPIKNLGPYCAYNLLTHIEILPFGAMVQGISGDGWSCTQNNSTWIDCTLPQLCVGAETSLRMDLIPPPFNSVSVTAHLSTTSLDPDLTSNDASIQISTDDDTRNTLSGTGLHVQGCQFSPKSEPKSFSDGVVLSVFLLGFYLAKRRRKCRQDFPRGLL